MDDQIYCNIMHLFILNPKSFLHKWKQDEMVVKIHNFFQTMGVNDYDIHVSRFPRDAVNFIPLFAKNLPADTTLRVYAVGGDGILFDCLNGIMGLENAQLAAMPYGQTNNFLRGFGRKSIAHFRDIASQYNAPVIPIDVLHCGDKYSLSYCVIGLEAEAIRYADRMRQKIEKGNALSRWIFRRLYTWNYFIGALFACFDKTLLNQCYDIEIDGDNTTGLFWGISVFNGSYYGGNLHPVSHAKANDGFFDALLTRGKNFFLTYLLFPFYVTGRYKAFPANFSLKQGRKIWIRSFDRLMISMDDITFVEYGLSIELLPGAVKFVDAGMHGYLGTGND